MKYYFKNQTYFTSSKTHCDNLYPANAPKADENGNITIFPRSVTYLGLLIIFPT